MIFKAHGVRAFIFYHGNILLIKRASSEKDDPGSWDIPGGKIEKGEDIFTALKREVLEETGIDSSQLSINDFYGFLVQDYTKVQKLTIAIFLCASATKKIILNQEHTAYQWIRKRDIINFKCGRILHDYTALRGM